MSAQKDYTPAFPLYREEGDGYGSVNRSSESGMAMRDWFAGKALAGLVAFQYGGHLGRIFDHQKTIADAGEELESPQNYTARIAYSLADAMMAERNK